MVEFRRGVSYSEPVKRHWRGGIWALVIIVMELPDAPSLIWGPWQVDASVKSAWERYQYAL